MKKISGLLLLVIVGLLFSMQLSAVSFEPTNVIDLTVTENTLSFEEGGIILPAIDLPVYDVFAPPSKVQQLARADFFYISEKEILEPVEFERPVVFILNQVQRVPTPGQEVTPPLGGI